MCAGGLSTTIGDRNRDRSTDRFHNRAPRRDPRMRARCVDGTSLPDEMYKLKLVVSRFCGLQCNEQQAKGFDIKS